MNRSGFRPKALSTFALTVVLTVLATGRVAQAETGAQWTYINPQGQLFAFQEWLSPLISGSLDSSTASLDFTTGGGTKVQFTCTGLFVAGFPKLLINGSISSGRMDFTGCQTLLNEKVSAACLPKSGGPFGQIGTNTGHGLLELHTLWNGTKDDVVLLLPLVTNAKGEPLAATIELGEECSIGTSVPVTGNLVVADTVPAEALTHKMTHLIQEFPGLKLLKALGQPATLLGTANAFLFGEHGNYKWAAKPA